MNVKNSFKKLESSNKANNDGKQTIGTLKGSTVNLVPRERAGPRSMSRPTSAMAKVRPAQWRRPASADLTDSLGRARSACRATSSLCVSPRKTESALSICQKSGFCGADALVHDGRNGSFSRPAIHPDAHIIDPELMRYAYTAESAKLLQSLLREPWCSDDSEHSNPSSTRSHLRPQAVCGRRTTHRAGTQSIRRAVSYEGCTHQHCFDHCLSSNRINFPMDSAQHLIEGDKLNIPVCSRVQERFSYNVARRGDVTYADVDDGRQLLRTSTKPQVPPPSPESASKTEHNKLTTNAKNDNSCCHKASCKPRLPSYVNDDISCKLNDRNTNLKPNSITGKSCENPFKDPEFTSDNDTLELCKKYVNSKDRTKTTKETEKENFQKSTHNGIFKSFQTKTQSPREVLEELDVDTEVLRHLEKDEHLETNQRVDNKAHCCLSDKCRCSEEHNSKESSSIQDTQRETPNSQELNSIVGSIINDNNLELLTKDTTEKDSIPTGCSRIPMEFSDNFCDERTPLCARDIPDGGSQISTDDKNKEDDLKFQRWFQVSEKESQKTVRFKSGNDNIEDVPLIDLTSIPENAQVHIENVSSTLKDIEKIIDVLDKEEDLATVDIDTPDSPVMEVQKDRAKASEIFNFLDQVERCSEVKTPSVKIRHVPELSETAVPRMEELLCRSSVDLAQEVLALRLQAEEQAGGIKLLQQTVAEIKEHAKEERLAHQAELKKKCSENESALLKHQKSVKQLLAEKKTLNDKLAELINELKTSEERHQRNLKAQQERHLVEIQRVKETHAAAEKLKREKWIDVKTQKIKEMTVKGLEPELSRMAARQQQEMAELRRLHRDELEAVELKAARRTTELMDELRADLTRDKEDALQREVNVQRLKWEKRLEEDSRMYEDELKRVKDDLRRERDRLNALEVHVQDQLLESRRTSERERERDRQAVIREWEEKLDEAARQHQIEMKNLKDALELEKDVWMSNYKKIQANKYLEKEADLHHHYKRERDREIEIAIEKLETEACKARTEYAEAAENKLRRLREKLDGEIKELEGEVTSLKSKLSDTRQQLAEKDDLVTELRGQLRHLQAEFQQVKKMCDEMAGEKSDLRRVVQAELDCQLAEAQLAAEAARRELSELKTQHAVELTKCDQAGQQIRDQAERELQQVYTRVKATIKKKEEALEVQREQYRVVLERCSHLEAMLDNQRKNLLLK